MMNQMIAKNKRNTVLIMVTFIGLIGAVGYVVASIYTNLSIMWVMIAVSLVFVLIQYFNADKLALMSTGAKQVSKKDAPDLYEIVEEIAIKTKMPMPKVYIINDPAPNAFATGRNPQKAVVAATTGIMEVMDKRELKAVMAHEMGHVRNYDIRVSMITFGLVSVLSGMTDFALNSFIFGGFGRDDDEGPSPIMLVIGAVMVFLVPFIAMAIQLAVSRQREYLADATGAETTSDPEGLARALEKLMHYGRPMQKQSSSTAHLFFSNPLKNGMIAKMFSTHPPLEDRIARLRGLK